MTTIMHFMLEERRRTEPFVFRTSSLLKLVEDMRAI